MSCSFIRNRNNNEINYIFEGEVDLFQSYVFELRKKYVIKIWNLYSKHVEYYEKFLTSIGQSVKRIIA